MCPEEGQNTLVYKSKEGTCRWVGEVGGEEGHMLCVVLTVACWDLADLCGGGACSYVRARCLGHLRTRYRVRIKCVLFFVLIAGSCPLAILRLSLIHI